MNVPDRSGSLAQVEWDIAHLYMVAIFERTDEKL